MAARAMPTAAHRLPLVLALALVTGCGGGTVEPEEPVPTTITTSPTSISMDFLGQNLPLSATVLDQNGERMTTTVTWSSDDESVVTVGNTGVARSVANGEAEITATAGSVSATIDVSVEQQPSSVVAVSGDDQEAIAGNALGDPVVVRVQDRGGQPVEGVTVTFTPDTDHGSVSVESVESDDDGLAETVWTLGDFFGPHRLVVSIGVSESDVSAIARSDTPTPDLQAVGSLTTFRPDPTNLDVFDVRATIRNAGDASTGTTYTVQVLSDGVEIASEDYAALDGFDAEQEVEIAVGPLAHGQHDLEIVVDPDDDILELNEVNNTLEKTQLVLQQIVIAPGTTPNLSATTGTETLYRLEVAPGSGTLTVELSGGPGDADLFIDGPDRPADKEDYRRCVSAGPTNTEACQIVDAEGSYNLIVHAFATYSSMSMDVSLHDNPLPFDIELVFIDNGSAAQDQAVMDAAAQWMDVVIGDVPDVDFSQQTLAADACIDGQEQVSSVIDDVRMYVSIVSIDGAGGTLAQAGPCVRRAFTFLPIIGTIQFDQVDLQSLDEDDMYSVILHEMGHVLGIGSIWAEQGRLRNPSLPGNSGADTHFDGPLAVAAFDDAGGLSYTGGGKVPVENEAGPGSGDSHWREAALDEELMTPFLDSGPVNPLSAITVQSLADLGYSVDIDVADPFVKVFTLQEGAPARGGIEIDLRGDVLQRPVLVVDDKGRVVEVHR